MIEAISTSDFHFESMGKHFQDDIGVQIKEIDRIYQYAVTKGIKHIFIPGDISDTPYMKFSTYIRFVLFMKKYDGLVNSYYIGGNHDRSDVESTSCDLLKLLADEGFFKTFKVYLQPEQERIDGTLVNFCAWPATSSMSENEGSLNLAHITVTGAIGDNGRALRVKDEFGVHERDYTISGHIHQYQHLKNKKVIYNGNPYQKNFGEKLPKGFIHFKARTERKTVDVRHRFVDNNPHFQLHTVHIESPADFQRLKDSNNIRYKLIVAPDVIVPSDLRIQYPNITGGIFNTESKNVETEFEYSTVARTSAIKPTTGLKQFLSGEGYTKRDISNAVSIVREAMNEIGVNYG